jgi:hypothetical protein
MHKFHSILIIGLLTLFACCHKADVKENSQSEFQGMWIRDGDIPGRQPADTILFYKKDGKDLLFYHFSSTPGVNWPATVETEYKFENGKLSIKDNSGISADFFPIESFEWVIPKKQFKVKLYQIVRYMSADYSVTYRREN